MIAASNGVSRLQLTDTFGATAPRNHDGKSLLEPLRQTHNAQLGDPTGKMGMR